MTKNDICGLIPIFIAAVMSVVIIVTLIKL